LNRQEGALDCRRDQLIEMPEMPLRQAASDVNGYGWRNGLGWNIAIAHDFLPEWLVSDLTSEDDARLHLLRKEL